MVPKLFFSNFNTPVLGLDESEGPARQTEPFMLFFDVSVSELQFQIKLMIQKSIITNY